MNFFSERRYAIFLVSAFCLLFAACDENGGSVRVPTAPVVDAPDPEQLQVWTGTSTFESLSPEEGPLWDFYQDPWLGRPYGTSSESRMDLARDGVLLTGTYGLDQQCDLSGTILETDLSATMSRCLGRRDGSFQTDEKTYEKSVVAIALEGTIDSESGIFEGYERRSVRLHHGAETIDYVETYSVKMTRP